MQLPFVVKYMAIKNGAEAYRFGVIGVEVNPNNSGEVEHCAAYFSEAFSEDLKEIAKNHGELIEEYDVVARTKTLATLYREPIEDEAKKQMSEVVSTMSAWQKALTKAGFPVSKPVGYDQDGFDVLMARQDRAVQRLIAKVTGSDADPEVDPRKPVEGEQLAFGKM